ncbi:Alpha/beta hydrolase fold-1 [Colletotrichum godetiae]|uniref:Alpha/beta hydrolase fold-1 n=1 Tax=Colletotrichum godetiae TaxID=1209918 RepID=A0AAJ0EZE4_9PEZI|nr:Alpha/beta hydrolase fold-1 [Colletotrichum godetiae]KAK1689606.1 Alpha/beta hydrolase fold-1 [Colletotrichum godetiae]
MSTTKPTFVLAPGAWHKETCYSPAQELLEARGYPVEAVEYPSVGAEPPTKGLTDDANAVRAVLQRLADEGKEIVLVVHSYGGLVGANAVEGLGYKQRAKEGKKGGVITFVYLTAFVVPKGKCIREMLGGQFLPWMKFEGNYVYAQTPEEIFYHDVAPETRVKAIEQLQHQSAQVFDDVVTYEPWHEIDSMFFFCNEDKAIPLAVQQGMATLLGPTAITFSSKASHSPFLSQPGDVAEGLELAAKVGQERVRA